MSAFWYRVGRGRFSIRIAPAKSTRFLLVLVKSATVVEKSWIICRGISWFLQISLRGKEIWVNFYGFGVQFGNKF